MCAFCEYQDQLVRAVRIVFDVDVTYSITPIYEGDTWTMYKKLFRQDVMTIDSWTEQFTHEVKLFSGPHGKALWNVIVAREKENAVPSKVS